MGIKEELDRLNKQKAEHEEQEKKYSEARLFQRKQILDKAAEEFGIIPKLQEATEIVRGVLMVKYSFKGDSRDDHLQFLLKWDIEESKERQDYWHPYRFKYILVTIDEGDIFFGEFPHHYRITDAKGHPEKLDEPIAKALIKFSFASGGWNGWKENNSNDDKEEKRLVAKQISLLYTPR